jgi:superfamily II DNA or RNA helicase
MKSTDLTKLKQVIKRKYRNGPDNIGRDFVAPCLSHSVLYRRGTGFFSSGALVSYAASMEHLIRDNVKVQIICSPVVHDKDLIKIIEQNITEEQKKSTLQKISDSIVLQAIGYSLDTSRKDYRRALLAYLIAKEILEIRFAVPLNFNELESNSEQNLTSNLYHVKNGYFKLTDGSIVAFDGSFNESESGHTHHIDQTQVWRSWREEDQERLSDVVSDIDEDWNSKNPFIKVFQLSDEALALIKKNAPDQRPTKKQSSNPVEKQTSIKLRDYQKEALEKWKNNNYKGILALATGTGKTKTAITAVKNLKVKNPSSLIIVTSPYLSLANQWISELNKNDLSTISVFESKENWQSRVANLLRIHNDISEIQTSLPVIVCVNKSFKSLEFQNLMSRLNGENNERLLVVDECHHFNKKNHIDKLPLNINYRMGLSATPYEPGAEKLLQKYFDRTVYEYSIKKAIKEDILCPYEYYPMLIEFSNVEAEAYIKAIKSISESEAEVLDDENLEDDSGNSSLKEIDRLLANVASKLSSLEKILSDEGIMPFTLFYCGEGSIEYENQKTRQIDTLTKMLAKMGWKVGKITYSESKTIKEDTLRAFGRKDIDAIASMRVLDEGIDIPDCSQAFILASQRLLRQGVQRRGRILRRSENKTVARLYDFIITGPNLNQKELEKLYGREISRAKLFADDALNRDYCISLLKGL